MYRGFNVKVDSYQKYYYQIGLDMFNDYERKTIKALTKFIGKDGVINGSDLKENWFSNIKADIFISHSHEDKEIAITLAGFLYEHFNLKSFIDSCIWGHSKDLLKEIDTVYCKNINSNTYNYNLRNFSTSHVHMMLSTSLNQMINNCECLFFLNTPESLKTSDLATETFSPWIYSEIITSKIIEKKEPQRFTKQLFENKTEMFSKSLSVKYKLDLSHLAELSEAEILLWSTENCDSPEMALDNLYKLKPAPNKIEKI